MSTAASKFGAATTAEEVLDGVDLGGIYLEDCQEAELNPGDGLQGVRPYAVDGDNAERLWQLAQTLVG